MLSSQAVDVVEREKKASITGNHIVVALKVRQR